MILKQSRLIYSFLNALMGSLANTWRTGIKLTKSDNKAKPIQIAATINQLGSKVMSGTILL